MTGRPHLFLGAWALLLATALQAVAAPGCALSEADRAWLETAVAAWRATSREALKIDAGPMPRLVLFDASCVWDVAAGAEKAPVTGAAHEGTLVLPDGAKIPARLATFAGVYGDDRRPFFVMAMPEVWRREPRHASEPNLDALVRAVFVHEMTHTHHTRFVGARIDALYERLGSPEWFDDDVVQNRFGEKAGFREAYETERDLLFRAAAERDPARRRALARQALEAMKARRARYFSGPDAVFAEVEDLFLNMEGVANWAAYRNAVREGMSEADAVAFIRRGGRRWSQDEGLAVFLVVDALVPGWQAKVFSTKPASVADLLSLAVL